MRMQFLAVSRGCRPGCSVDTTSSPAAATLPEFRASARSCSTTIWPRLLLIMMTPSFTLGDVLPVDDAGVEGEQGIWRPRTSDRANSSSEETSLHPQLQSFRPAGACRRR